MNKPITVMFCARLADWFTLLNKNIERRHGIPQEAIKRFRKELGFRVIVND
jgi:hypothetical protein